MILEERKPVGSQPFNFSGILENPGQLGNPYQIWGDPGAKGKNPDKLLLLFLFSLSTLRSLMEQLIRAKPGILTLTTFPSKSDIIILPVRKT